MPGTAQIEDLFNNLSKDVHDSHQVLINKLRAKSVPSINIVPGTPKPNHAQLSAQNHAQLRAHTFIQTSSANTRVRHGFL
jgi:hypothetical protein